MAILTAKERFQEKVAEAVTKKLGAEASFLDVGNLAGSIYDCVHTPNEQTSITLAVELVKDIYEQTRNHYGR